LYDPADPTAPRPPVSRPNHQPARLTLVTGGARSGKSAYAQQLAASAGSRVLFVATAEPKDEDMRQRIERHRASRPADWQTLEEPLSVAVALRSRFGGASRAQGPLVLLDCVTLLVSNLLLAGRPVQPEIEALIAWQQQSGARMIAVTNEVGLGIVPDNALARQYRDELGLANQALAAAAGTVVLMVAGLPIAIKQSR
jgi:adenosylcobinamide kinase/adenosylcobinamide-phosphate guanylyltransferase